MFWNWFYLFTCISPNHESYDIIKDFWWSNHFENMIAVFLLRCQNSLGWETSPICGPIKYVCVINVAHVSAHQKWPLRKSKVIFIWKKSLSVLWPGQRNVTGPNWQKCAKKALSALMVIFWQVHKIKNCFFVKKITFHLFICETK